MSDTTDRARTLLGAVLSASSDAETIAYLVRIVELLLVELEGHQHTYFGPATMHGKWSTTAPQRDTQAASQKIFEAQAAAKLAAKKGHQ